MKLINDFSGTAMGSYILSGDQLFVQIFEEPLVRVDGMVHDYSLHFCFGILNDESSEKNIRVFINATDSTPMPEMETNIYWKNSPEEEFVKSDIRVKTDCIKSYCFNIRLSPGETKYLANSCFRTYETLSRRFDELAVRSGAERKLYGLSVEKRQLIAYRYSAPAPEHPLPEIIVVSGSHPPEGDTFGTEGIMEMLSDPESRSRLLQLANLTVIPMVNPDGFVHGYGGCNANLRNVYWDFDVINETEMPETFLLWKLFTQLRPDVYFDFHGYTFQGRKKIASSYIKPLFCYPLEKWDLVRNLNRKVIDLCHGECKTGFLTFVPSTPGSRLTKKFGTVTYAKFHFHLDDGIARIKKMAVDLVLLASEEVNRYSRKRDRPGFRVANPFIKWIYSLGYDVYLFILIYLWHPLKKWKK
ncbi:MAG: hypothetical protein JW774_04535 [Candidatus Aureabacteria bacterium]|nr:hypothetical protein [Candidatus Auribacterota bacterium]